MIHDRPSPTAARPGTSMRSYQAEFLEFAIAKEVLRFGRFTLKSGRESPYFFNAGLFDSGEALSRLGRFYAQAIRQSGIGFEMLFGPAYKGIPLAAATAIALAQEHGLDIPFAFNRKEAKAHGEGGTTVGARLRGRVLIVDDVISAGTSVRESVTIIRAANARPVGVAIALDREERGRGERSAVQEIEREHGLRVVSVAALRHIVEYLGGSEAHAADLPRLRAYRERYGV